MNKKNINKKIIYCTVVIGVIGIISAGIYRHHKIKTYNMLLNEANNNLKSYKYDEAIILFKEAMKYKKDLGIKNSINLAEKLKINKKSYENALSFMKEERYLDAIDNFKKVSDIDKNLYKDSQKNIEECKKSLVSKNIMLSKESVSNNDYSKDNKYITDITNIDNNKEVKQLQKPMNKKIKSYPQKSENIENKSQIINRNINKPVSKQQAEDKIKNYIKSTSQEIPNLKVEYDHDDTKSGKKYFVIHVYCIVDDHTATMGWYYVNEQDGKCSKWDLAEDKLVPLT